MKITTIHDQGSGAINEDMYLVKKPLFAVFDGATSLSKYTNKDGKTGGYLAASIAKEIFSKSDSQNVKEDVSFNLYYLAVEANQSLERAMEQQGIDLANKRERWSTTAAVVRLAENYFDWLQVGDSFILIAYDDNSHKLLEKSDEHDQSWQCMWKKLVEEKNPRIKEIIQQEVEDLRQKMNVTYGFINGEKEMQNFVKGGRESLGGVKNIIMFTDGLIIPKEDPLALDNFGKLVDLFNEGGLERMVQYVRTLERNDAPGGVTPRRFYKHFYKQCDDIAAIALSFQM